MKSLALSLFVILFLLTANFAFSQATGSAYRTALGMRFSPAAVTIKHFVKSDAAIEGLGYFWDDGFRLTGLYEWHGDIRGAAGLKWYVGGGAHIDVWNNEYRDRYKQDNGGAAGLDAVLGLDYKFRGAPINISLDWQPSITFIGAGYSNPDWVGISFRFAW